MNIRFLCLFILFLVASSCASQKKEIEYVILEHECYIRKTSDKILVRILPSQKKDSNERIVELTYHGKFYIRKPINEKKYQNIIDSILKIKEKNQDSTKAFADGASNIIEYRKGLTIRKYHSQILDKEYNGSFYDACRLITKHAGLDITAIR